MLRPDNGVMLLIAKYRCHRCNFCIHADWRHSGSGDTSRFETNIRFVPEAGIGKILLSLKEELCILVKQSL
ncbi:hypothetical protein, partial [Pantoea ananatis]|uniref:hypothetical protein n=1 Tax=Pantoea ananas TaxID=553 RepID=UPI0023B17915